MFLFYFYNTTRGKKNKNYAKSQSMFNATCDKSKCIKLSKANNYNLINVKVQSPSLMKLFHLPLFPFKHVFTM